MLSTRFSAFRRFRFTDISIGLLALLLVSDITAQSTDWWTKTVLPSFEYRCVGPTRGGRVTAVAGVASDPTTYYLGATGGGVWKTEDYGHRWTNISDGFFATPSIGAITVDQAEPETIYVGTGSDGLRSNVIVGKGLYKTTDAGKTWRMMGLENTGQIGAVEIHPTDRQTVFVAAIGQPFQANAERGVYRSRDGGINWEKVLFINDKIGVVDLEFAPDNPDIIYAAAWRAERKPWTIISGGYQEGGIYKSTDGGDNWTKLETGLPQGLIGKIDLAVSAEDPQRLYALVEAPEADLPEGRGGLYRSDDYGASFHLVSTKKELLDRPFYYCNIKADPQNADVLYASATRFFKSTDGGKKWTRMATPHGDNHDLWINPNDSLNLVQANDGGANISLNGGKSWSTQFNQPTAELYQIEVDDQVPYWLYAGQQDNYSTIALPSLPPYTIQAGSEALILNVGGCETGPAVPKPGNPDIVYANCKGRFGVYNKRTGQEKRYYVGAGNMYGHNPKDLTYRFQRVSPIHVSPHDPNVVYHTSQFVHRTTDDGLTWETISPDLTAFEADKQMISGSPITRDITGEEFYSTIYDIQESPVAKGVIWTGANDGPVYVTRNGGADGWSKVTPANLPGGGRIDCVEPSPHRAGKAYITSLRYQLGDWKPYIFKTTDYGANWQLITEGIPGDFPVRVVREDPDREGLLYAGTEYGLFVSLDDGATWNSFQNNLPVTPITDLKVHQKDLIISTMGRSFWILDDLTVLHEASDKVRTATAYLVPPRDEYRLRYRSTGKNSIPQYPVASVNLHYFLQEPADQVIQLDILDAAGKVVRNFKSTDPSKEPVDKERNMKTEFSERGVTPDLRTTAGLHTFHWDMRHEGVWDKKVSRSGRNGPLVAPGQYTARLKVNNQVLEQSFRILADPKVLENGTTQADMRAQEAFNLDLRDLRSEGAKTLEQIREAKLKLKSKGNAKLTPTDKKRVAELVELAAQFVTKEGRYHQPMLMDQMRYLNYMTSAADQRPGRDAYQRLEELQKSYQELLRQFQKTKAKGSDQSDDD